MFLEILEVLQLLATQTRKQFKTSPPREAVISSNIRSISREEDNTETDQSSLIMDA